MTSSNPITAYELGEEALLQTQKGLIITQIRKAIGMIPHPGDYFNLIGPGGALSFWPHNAYKGKELVPGLPRGPEDAVKVGELILRKLMDAFQSDFMKEKLEGSLFSSLIQFVDVQPVYGDNPAQISHWLTRFQPFLSLGLDWGKAPVWGARIDIRIGAGGKLLGLESSWRPIKRALKVPHIPFDPEKVQARGHLGHGHGEPEHPGKAVSPELVYLFPDETSPQSHLAPYFLSMEGHHGEMQPASSYSMLPSFYKEDIDNGAAVMVLVAGGSGQFRFRWGGWSPDEVIEYGIKDLGQGKIIDHRINGELSQVGVIEVEQGAFNLIVDILDLKTGVKVRAETMVYAYGKDLANYIFDTQGSNDPTIV